MKILKERIKQIKRSLTDAAKEVRSSFRSSHKYQEEETLPQKDNYIVLSSQNKGEKFKTYKFLRFRGKINRF